MGRSLAPATQLIFDQITETRSLYDALRHSDQLILDEFFLAAQQHRAAIANAASLLPLETLLLIVQLEEHKKFRRLLNDLYSDLRAENQQLQEELQALKNMLA